MTAKKVSFIEKAVSANPILNLGYRTYSLKLRDGLKGSDSDECYGTCDFDEGEILFDSSLKKNDDFAKEVLLHEICHALTEIVGLGKDVIDEKPISITNEDLVTRVSRCLKMLFDLNPEFKEIL